MKTVRYGFHRDAEKLYVGDGPNFEIVKIDTNSFLDILSPMEEGSCNLVDVRVFFPDGRVIVGKVIGWLICIKNKDALFDGRFNAIPS